MPRRRTTPITDITPGMFLLDEDHREFRVSAVTTRVAVIVTSEGAWRESVSLGFTRCKYRTIAPEGAGQ